MNKEIFDFSEEDLVSNLKFHSFDENPEVIGILIDINDGQFGRQYVFQTSDSKKILVGSYIAINDKLSEKDIGKAVKIAYVGEKKSKNSFTYFFYKTSLIYSPVKSIYMSIDLGNKAMNLDKHFQTFYMCKQPFVGFNIRMEFNKKIKPVHNKSSTKIGV